MRSEDVRNRQWSDAERRVVQRIGKRQAAGRRNVIPRSDIPPLSPGQLAAMVRLRDVRQPKVQRRVLEWLKSKGDGHLTRINDILANLMEAERRAAQGRGIPYAP